MSGTGGSLAAFEEFLYWQDQPAYPCCLFMRLRFSGRLDRGALMTAVRTVMPRHPLLVSAIGKTALGVRWMDRPGALPEVQWIAGSSDRAFPVAGHLDPAREAGLRLLVVQRPDTCELVAQCHHSCSDGKGMEDFLNDLLTAYAAAANPGSGGATLPPLDETGLAKRRYCGLTPGAFLRALPGQTLGLPGVLHFVSRAPSPLVSQPAPAPDDPPPADYPAVRIHTLGNADTDALRNAARRLKVSVNDLLARDIYLALDAWSAPADTAWYRMMVPMNLRAAGQRRMPAANCVSAVFLDRRRRDFADRSKLLSGISGEMRRIKDWKLGYIFLYSLWLVGLVPGAIRYKVRQDRCYSTCVFTNMGRIFARPGKEGGRVADGLVLDDASFIAPLRPHTAATFGATEYAGRLSMTIHYDSRAITPARADELTAAFARAVRETISSAT